MYGRDEVGMGTGPAGCLARSQVKGCGRVDTVDGCVCMDGWMDGWMEDGGGCRSSFRGI